MDLTTHTSKLRTDLVAAAALGDEQTQATAAALADAAETSARLMLLAALSEFADDVSAALGDRTVRVILSGTEAVVDVRADETETPEESDRPVGDLHSSFDDFTGDISRVTLRLVEQLKTKAEDAASQNGQSLNSWLSQAVQGALNNQSRHSQSRRNGPNWS